MGERQNIGRNNILGGGGSRLLLTPPLLLPPQVAALAVDIGLRWNERQRWFYLTKTYSLSNTTRTFHMKPPTNTSKRDLLSYLSSKTPTTAKRVRVDRRNNAVLDANIWKHFPINGTVGRFSPSNRSPPVSLTPGYRHNGVPGSFRSLLSPGTACWLQTSSRREGGRLRVGHAGPLRISGRPPPGGRPDNGRRGI